MPQEKLCKHKKIPEQCPLCIDNSIFILIASLGVTAVLGIILYILFFGGSFVPAFVPGFL